MFIVQKLVHRHNKNTGAFQPRPTTNFSRNTFRWKSICLTYTANFWGWIFLHTTIDSKMATKIPKSHSPLNPVLSQLSPVHTITTQSNTSYPVLFLLLLCRFPLLSFPLFNRHNIKLHFNSFCIALMANSYSQAWRAVAIILGIGYLINFLIINEGNLHTESMHGVVNIVFFSCKNISICMDWINENSAKTALWFRQQYSVRKVAHFFPCLCLLYSNNSVSTGNGRHCMQSRGVLLTKVTHIYEKWKSYRYLKIARHMNTGMIKLSVQFLPDFMPKGEGNKSTHLW
jgi:hypothetical protein